MVYPLAIGGACILTSIVGTWFVKLGKSKNIKSRINQHFSGQTPKSKKIQLEVASVSYEKTGSELLALLKESEEIKYHKPKFNRALRMNENPLQKQPKKRK